MMETEEGNFLPFLNVLLERNPDSSLANTIYRKHTSDPIPVCQF
jgi:hypothetical protein